jgi:membrane-associated protease RseP (regulator of RpoE activity)
LVNLVAFINAAWITGLLAVALPEWIGSVGSVVLIVLGFSVIIFVHELGHFVMAKLMGVRVHTFAIGFGKELLGRTVGETRYSLRVLPLGGYVQMLGQEDFTIDKSNEWAVREDPRSYSSKPPGKRMLIISAGVMMNLLFAALAFMIVFMMGYETMPPVVGQVVPDSPAQKAGLIPGDRILEINGSRMNDYPDVKSAIVLADADRPITMRVQRPGQQKPITISLEPAWSEEEKIRQIGIYPPMTLQIGAIDLESDLEEKDEHRLHVGDIIVEVGGVKVTNYEQVERLITAKRGEPVEVLVNRPIDSTRLEGATRPVTCTHRSRMIVMSATSDSFNRHILGLQPRQRLLRVTPGGPADAAGLRAGDIIVKWGDRWNPTDAECTNMLHAKDDGGRYVYSGRSFEVIVRRVGLSKEIGGGPGRPTGVTLTYSQLERVLAGRDALIARAYKDPGGVREQIIALLGKAISDSVILAEVRSDLTKRAASAGELVRWLIDLDCETFVIRPETSLWGKAPPSAGVMFGLLETDRLILSRIVEKGLEGKPTPAAGLNIPNGALITRVNDRPVTTWLELVDAFRIHAGRGPVTLTYTHEGSQGSAMLRVPQSLTDALNLPPTAKVIHIAGQEKATFKRDGQAQQVALPAWEAAYEILKAHQGQTVKVVYGYMDKEFSTDPNGRDLTYKVTADNYDPWMMRIVYTALLIPFPERMILQNRNPIIAMWMGFKKTGYFILQAYKTMEHIAITHEVGVGHISGPVGILRYGHEVAQAGFTKLLYFLAFISANLAVINFLPLPIVDGGHMVFLLIEKIRGRPLSVKMQAVTQIIGLVLIITAFILVTFLDVSKWVTQG